MEKCTRAPGYAAIDNKLYELWFACEVYKSEDAFSTSVSYAVSRYINTGRAPVEFLINFVNFPSDQFAIAIEKSLDCDKSMDAITNKFKEIIAKQ